MAAIIFWAPRGDAYTRRWSRPGLRYENREHRTAPGKRIQKYGAACLHAIKSVRCQMVQMVLEAKCAKKVPRKYREKNDIHGRGRVIGHSSYVITKSLKRRIQKSSTTCRRGVDREESLNNGINTPIESNIVPKPRLE
jgi:hypothetical protein